MKMNIISVTDYAKRQGLTRQAIIKRLKKNQALPGIKKSYKSGDGKTSHYILVME